MMKSLPTIPNNNALVKTFVNSFPQTVFCRAEEGCFLSIHPSLADEWLAYFTVTHQIEIDLDVPFTRESWNGRIKTCRGIGASLPPEEIAVWEAEHLQLLERIAPELFSVRHYAALAELTKKSEKEVE